jgi:hypothetical protein
MFMYSETFLKYRIGYGAAIAVAAQAKANAAGRRGLGNVTGGLLLIGRPKPARPRPAGRRPTPRAGHTSARGK